MAKVIQADREACARYCEKRGHDPVIAAFYRSGKGDNMDWIQAFAEYREHLFGPADEADFDL